MAAILPSELNAFVERWKLSRERDVFELRRTSMDIKLRQLSALMASRHIFGADPVREREALAVSARWRALRAALGE